MKICSKKHWIYFWCSYLLSLVCSFILLLFWKKHCRIVTMLSLSVCDAAVHDRYICKRIVVASDEVARCGVYCRWSSIWTKFAACIGARVQFITMSLYETRALVMKVSMYCITDREKRPYTYHHKEFNPSLFIKLNNELFKLLKWSNNS